MIRVSWLWLGRERSGWCATDDDLDRLLSVLYHNPFVTKLYAVRSPMLQPTDVLVCDGAICLESFGWL